MGYDEFGERMKSYEKKYENYLDITKPVVVRIDGKNFSKFTSGMMKPFDLRMQNCMYNTAMDIMEETNASMAYVQSDEITLVFIPSGKNNECKIPFSGRIQKTVSYIAAKTTAYFIRNYDFIQKSEEKQGESSYFYVEGSKPFKKDVVPCFDCRIFNVDSVGEASNQVLWRVQDAVKNSISCVFRYTLGHSRMQNLSGKQMIDVMASEGIDYYQFSSDSRSGVIYKKIKKTNITGETTSYVDRISGLDFKLKNFKERVDYVSGDGFALDKEEDVK